MWWSIKWHKRGKVNYKYLKIILKYLSKCTDFPALNQFLHVHTSGQNHDKYLNTNIWTHVQLVNCVGLMCCTRTTLFIAPPIFTYGSIYYILIMTIDALYVLNSPVISSTQYILTVRWRIIITFSRQRLAVSGKLAS